MILFVSADPGSKGAVAVIDEHANIIDLHDYRGIAGAVEWAHGLKQFADLVGAQVFITVEEVNGDNEWGMGKSTVLIGNRWLWVGILSMAFPDVTVRTVRPRDWQKTHWPLSLTGECVNNKKKSLAVARQLWPEERRKGGRLNLEGHHDRADALLMADRQRQVMTLRRNSRLPGG